MTHRGPYDPENPTPDPIAEIDVALESEGLAPSREARHEAMDYVGSYSSIPGYLRAMLEPEVTPTCAWILDHLDYVAVQRRWESDGGRLVLERGHVYRCVPRD